MKLLYHLMAGFFSFYLGCSTQAATYLEVPTPFTQFAPAWPAPEGPITKAWATQGKAVFLNGLGDTLRVEIVTQVRPEQNWFDCHQCVLGWDAYTKYYLGVALLEVRHTTTETYSELSLTTCESADCQRVQVEGQPQAWLAMEQEAAHLQPAATSALAQLVFRPGQGLVQFQWQGHTYHRQSYLAQP